MSGDEPAVRRGGSVFATRSSQASAALSWVAIGGIAVAVYSGGIAVVPSEQQEPTTAAASYVQQPSSGARLREGGPSETQAAALVETAPTSGKSADTAPNVTALDREEIQALSAGVEAGSSKVVTGSIEVAVAAAETRRGARSAVERKSAENVAQTPAAKAPEAAASPIRAGAPAAVDGAPTWSDDVIRSAREECTALMNNLSAEWSIAPPMRTASCGAPGPISLRSVGTGKVTLAPAALTNCSTAAALARWMDEHVQPAAVKHFGARVAQVTIATSYDCRNRYGLAQAPLSEHALANALDLSGFKLTNGRVVTVLGGWGPTARSTQKTSAESAAAPTAGGKTAEKSAQNVVRMGLGAKPAAAENGAKSSTSAVAPPTAKQGSSPVARSAEAEFLHGVHSGACSVFGTVLGPEANEAHRDHFHLDMKYRRRNSFCQ
jgi:hypothetical protein